MLSLNLAIFCAAPMQSGAQKCHPALHARCLGVPLSLCQAGAVQGEHCANTRASFAPIHSTGHLLQSHPEQS